MSAFLEQFLFTLSVMFLTGIAVIGAVFTLVFVLFSVEEAYTNSIERKHHEAELLRRRREGR